MPRISIVHDKIYINKQAPATKQIKLIKIKLYERFSPSRIELQCIKISKLQSGLPLFEPIPTRQTKLIMALCQICEDKHIGMTILSAGSELGGKT